MTQLQPRHAAVGTSELVAYDFGAHLASWSVAGAPVVWCSPRARLDGSAAIRGGVPLCLPWFGGGPTGDRSPSHGLARTATWTPTAVGEGELLAWRLDSAELVGTPGADSFPAPFTLRYAVSVTGVDHSPTLRLDLAITNPAEAELVLEAALHTYLAVADVEQVQVHGLEGSDYLDKVTGSRRRQDGPVTFAGETDRVYDRAAPVVVADLAGDRSVVVEPTGATQTVVWNPWAEKAAAMADLGEEAWRGFVCVETAATGELPLVVPPGGTVRMGADITPSGPVTGVTR